MPVKRKPGRPRKVKVVEPDEILMPDSDENEQPRLAKRKHTIETEFEEVVAIDDAGEVISDDDNEIPEVEERKAYVRSERERIRAKLKKAGISSNQPLRLRCDRLPNYKIDGTSGTAAEKAFCFSIECDENFVANGENLVMEIQKRCGPGDYWMTLRYKNSVLDQWKETIAAPNTVITDPITGQPTFNITMPQQNQPAPVNPLVADSTKLLRDFARESFQDQMEMMREMKKEMRNSAMVEPVATIPPGGNIEDRINKVLDSQAGAEAVLGKIFGGGKSDRKDLWQLAFENGPAIIKEIANGIREVMSEGYRQAQWQAQQLGANGTAQMVSPQVAQAGQNRQAQPGLATGGVDQSSQAPQGEEQGQTSHGNVSSHLGAIPQQQAPPHVTFLLSAMQQNADPQEVANAIKQTLIQAPQYKMEIERVLALSPGGVIAEFAQYGPEAVKILSAPPVFNWIFEVQTACDSLMDEGQPEGATA